jgi:1-deoxy-D-xylulose-5-phosphate reductoisomerase
VLNAANEVAVHAFLEGRLTFNGIPEVIDHALQELGGTPVHSFETLFAVDADARDLAAERIGVLA